MTLSPEERAHLETEIKKRRSAIGLPEDSAPAKLISKAPPTLGFSSMGAEAKNWLKEQLPAMLEKSASMPEDVYECAECRDSGFVYVEKDRRTYSRRCECQHKKRRQSLMRNCGLPEIFTDKSLENYQVGENGFLQSVRIAALKFVEQWPVGLDRPGLILWGSYGGGKTHLAVSILRLLIEQKSAKCLFRSYSDLLQQLQGTYTTGYVEDEDRDVVVTAYELISDVVECDVLVLDDIGREKLTEWNRSMLYHLINKRYNHKRSTIVTTNLSWNPAPLNVRMTDAQRVMRPESLRERVGEAIHSRLEAMCSIFEVRADRDWRRKQ